MVRVGIAEKSMSKPRAVGGVSAGLLARGLLDRGLATSGTGTISRVSISRVSISGVSMSKVSISRVSMSGVPISEFRTSVGKTGLTTDAAIGAKGFMLGVASGVGEISKAGLISALAGL